MAKYLCVCDGGNVRSHALAYILHDLLGHEAIAVGRIRISSITMDLMCIWADTIVIMQPHMQESIDEKYHNKLKCVDVGTDRYGIWIHPDLLPQVKAGAEWLTGQKLE